MSQNDEQLTFWEHLDELRSVVVRIVVCLVVLTLVLFCFKDSLFSVVLAPSHGDFLLYRLFDSWTPPVVALEKFNTQLINTELTGQFMAHIQVAFYCSLLVGSPYVLYQIFNYLSPALYKNERKLLLSAIVSGSMLFFLGVAVTYWVIFPLSFRFLVLYQVSDEVANMIQLSSYLDTMLLMTMLMGILFELPLVSVLLAKFGFVSAEMMSRYRRHAVLVILVVAAVITPTTDVFTLSIVTLPIYMLYEMSILAVSLVRRRR